MLDEVRVKLPAGFPDHPHRGMETVSYMIGGQFLHEDSKGNSGTLGPGDVQWMTAGKGILHSEMPGSFEEESHGFQLWINLERKNKYCEPDYQEYKANEIPFYDKDGIRAKVVAGKVFHVESPLKTRTPAYYMDFNMDAGKLYEHIIPKGWNSMIILYQGTINVQGESKSHTTGTGILFKIGNTDEKIRIECHENGTRFLFLAGKPLNEPIAHRGPFVLNERAELY